jgi:hypothetical protein
VRYFAEQNPAAGQQGLLRGIMAKLTINSLLREALAVTGKELPQGGKMEIEARSVMALIKAIDQLYPGSGAGLMQASVSIDGDIYTDALTEPLDEFSEVVFLLPIEGG